MAGTTLIHLYLLVDELVVNSDIVERHLVLTTQLCLKLGGYGNVELKLQGLVALEVELSLLIAWQGLAQHVNLVVLNIAVELLAQQLVHYIYLHGRTVLTLNHTHRGLSWTESGNVCTLTIVLQGFVNLRLIVSRLQRDGHQTIHLVGSFKLDIHLLSYTLLNIYTRF